MRDPNRGHDLLPRGASPRPSRVFISWSRDADDADCVLELANHLRREGVDARLDCYEVGPAEGWAQWARREFEAADFILVVCTVAYRQRFDGDEPAASGRAVRWEGQLLRQRLFEDPSFGARVVPVLLVGATPQHIPGELRGRTAYQLPADHDDLYRRLTGQPGVVIPPLGELRRSPSNLPAPPPNFVGRDRELADIAAALARESSAALARESSAALVQAITGLGGVGKTRLALEYAHRHARDYDVRWWVRAATLEQDLVGLGRVLGVLSQPDDVDRSFPEIIGWLRNHCRWLLVVDNADDASGLRERLPLPAAGHILITSRARAWRGLAAQLEVHTLPRDAAIDLLVKRSGRADDGHADAIARALGDLPLALVQAGAFIEQTRCTFGEYLQRLRDEGIELLRNRLDETGDYYQQTVTTTWRLNLSAVRSKLPGAADLLDFLAFLDPDGVPLALLREHPAHLPERVAAVLTAPSELDQALALLRRFSLVEREDGGLRVHRLVQAVTRDALAAEARHSLAAATVAWAEAVFAYDPTDPHVGRVPAAIASQILAMSELKACIDGAGSELSWLCGALSNYFLLSGQSIRAREAAAYALRVSEAAADPTSTQAQRDLAVTLGMLGDVEVQAGNLAAARGHYERGLKVSEALAEADPMTSYQAQHDLLIFLGKLGDVEVQAGNLAAARGHYERRLKVSEALLEPYPWVDRLQRNLCLSLFSLGGVEVQAGNLAAARGHYERGFKVSEALAERYPTSAQAQRDLCVFLGKLGDVEIQAGNLAAAREFGRRDLKLAEALARADTHNAEASFAVVLSHGRLAFLAAQAQDLATLVAHLSAAKTILTRMEQAGQVRGYARREALLAHLDRLTAASFLMTLLSSALTRARLLPLLLLPIALLAWLLLG